MKVLRIYPDTSVVGGCFDEEFTLKSRALFSMVGRGGAVLVISDILVNELAPSPPRGQELVVRAAPAGRRAGLCRRRIGVPTGRVFAGRGGRAAPAPGCPSHCSGAGRRPDLLVSRNFKHIVRYDKIRVFNAVNLKEGYPPIDIRSPLEVVP